MNETRNLLTSVERGVLLRVEAAAILLGIGRTKMYHLIRRGQIPVVRIGRRTLIHRETLEGFAQELRETSRAMPAAPLPDDTGPRGRAGA